MPKILEVLWMRKVDKKYFSFVFAGLMAFFISGLVSSGITIIQFGMTETLATDILRAWSCAFPIAFVASQCVAPLVRRLTFSIVEN